jgi:hypothetical protein
VLDIAMSEVCLQRPRIMPSVRQSETARMPQHVGVRFEWQLGHLSCPLDHPGEDAVAVTQPAPERYIGPNN